MSSLEEQLRASLETAMASQPDHPSSWVNKQHFNEEAPEARVVVEPTPAAPAGSTDIPVGTAGPGKGSRSFAMRGNGGKKDTDFSEMLVSGSSESTRLPPTGRK